MMDIMLMSAVDFLSPVGWWGLLGLLVPLVIHLLSKREKNIVSFGSLRFLQAIDSDSARSIQLSQYTLLFLRMLLLGLICLLLVGPIIKEEIITKAYWIEEDIYRSGSYESILNNLPQDATINVYSHEASDSIGVRHYPSIWTLINQLNNNTDSAVVYSHSLQKNYVGNPVSLTSKVKWIMVPYKNGMESIGRSKIVNASRNQISINGESETLSSETLKLALLADGYDQEAAQFKKMMDVSKDYLGYNIQWTTSQITEEKEDSWKVTIGGNGQKEYARSIHWEPSDQQLAIEMIGDQSLHLKGKIDRENIIESNLPVRLAAMFNNDITKIHNYDIRVIHPSQFGINREEVVSESLLTENVALATSPKPMHIYVLLLIILVLLAERYLNYKNVEG